MKLALSTPAVGPLPTFARVCFAPASARRGRRCPAVAQAVAVGAGRRLPCAARQASVPHNSLRSLRSLRSDNMRQKCLRSALRAPPARLRCSAPQTAPPPGTACRSTHRGGPRREPPRWVAKGCPGGVRRAYEAPSNAGCMASARSAPRKHFWRILSERSERSERSELCAGPWTLVAQGSRRPAPTASSARCAPPGQPFAATPLASDSTSATGRKRNSVSQSFPGSRVLRSTAEN